MTATDFPICLLDALSNSGEHSWIELRVKPGGKSRRRRILHRSGIPAGPTGGGVERERAVRELLRTNDPIRLSWLAALLASEGIEAIVLDTHTSLVEGSIGAIPRRLMVNDEDAVRARRILADAGESVDE